MTAVENICYSGQGSFRRLLRTALAVSKRNDSNALQHMSLINVSTHTLQVRSKPIQTRL